MPIHEEREPERGRGEGQDEYIPDQYRERREREGIAEKQLKTEDIIKKLKLALLNRGVRRTESGEFETFQKGPPLINEDGVEEIISCVLGGQFQRGIMLSNFTDRDINMIMKRTKTKLVMLLGRKYKQFDIEKANLSTIVNLVENILFATYKRAAHEGERKAISQQQQVSEQRVIQEDKTSKGFSIFGRGGEK